MQQSGEVGPQLVSDGVGTQAIRQGRSGELVTQELHGRFYEQTYRGNMYSVGMTLNSISSANFATGVLSSGAIPIIGLWNPLNSGVGLAVTQAILNVSMTAMTATGPGGFAWCGSNGNANMLSSTQLVPMSRKTLQPGAALGRGYANGALAGLTNNLTVMFGSALGGGSLNNFSNLGTSAGFMPQNIGSVENFDGSLVVPPGAVLALLATTTPVAHSAVSGIIWEEVPL